MTGRSNVRVCKVTDCLSVVTSRGWCEKHYRRWRRTGTVADPERGPSVCTVSGCSLPVDARALCHGHYQRRQRTGSVQAHIPLGRRRQPEICAVEGCGRNTNSHGLCRTHVWRLQKHGEVEPEGIAKVVTKVSEFPPDQPLCIEPHCLQPGVARQRCRHCYKLALRNNTVKPDRSVRVVTGNGWLSHGYWVIPVPAELRHLTGGRGEEAEHRLVMAQVLGRALEDDEQVHHRNGNRLDNQVDNLELWSTSQPSGQRVAEKLDWALSMLQRYAPEFTAEPREKAAKDGSPDGI